MNQDTAIAGVGSAFNTATPAGLSDAQQKAVNDVKNAFAPPVPPPPVTPPPSDTPTSSTNTPTPTTPGTPAPTPVTSSTVGPSDQNGNAVLQDQPDRQALAQANADYQAQAKQVSDTITNIQNGTTPLSAGEQAQVDGLKQQFQALISQQELVNKGANGTAQMRGYQGGAAEYDPTFQAKTIGAVVSAGQAKVADLQIKEASAVATLTQSLKDNDIKAAQDAWSIYQDAAKNRQDALKSTIADTQQAIKDAQDALVKQQQYDLDVAKFNQTGDQNAFDNAFKTEQEKFSEASKTADQANNAAQLAETTRHNQATESVARTNAAIAAFNAGMGAGGGNNVGVSQSAQLGPTGPDPASQKAVLDQITSKYGPMTAVAIQGLANYEMNPADWSTRAGKGGMTREQAVTLAKMYDPTYSDTNYSIRATYLKNLASSQTGTVGSAVNSANKAINHLTSFVTSMGTLPNGPVGFLNGFDNAMTLNQGVKQNVSRAQTEGLGVAEELAKFFKGSGTVDVASIDAWKSQLSTNASPASVKGMTQGAIDLLGGQLETLAEQYQNTMGKAPPTDFLNPSARASLSSLKNQGYQVDIPGILYTDKNAYMKNDPDAQTNMTTAVKQLTDAGLPVTPENILQMAQSQ